METNVIQKAQELGIAQAKQMSKEEIHDLASNLTNYVLQSKNDILQVRRNLKYVKELVTQVEKGLGEQTQVAFSERQKNKFDYQGVTFSLATRKNWDFSNDNEWSTLMIKLKQREALLKLIERPMPDPETGEILNPPIVTETKSISISIK